ncbi:hypothetical protein B0J17DRAFT_768296 [Rhizoctonia solani]|nr:hypothetical protein B0J17DRAFT_768296 [Rhizoctonia solani]
MARTTECRLSVVQAIGVMAKNFLNDDSINIMGCAVNGASYLCGSSETYGTWIIAGTAIRMMQDIGSHRMRSPQTLENKLHKRCFWSMLLIDRYYGVHLGRNAAMFGWDSDLDNVLEVDDDLWSLNPDDPPPVQPLGVVSKLRIFNQVIGLIRLYGRCLQTLYTPGRTKRMLGLRRPQGSSWGFNDINARLKDWARRVPSNLQLPHPERYNDSPSFASIITMWGIYYELVISANRSFITRSSRLAPSALSICRRAAREFANMATAHFDTPGSRPSAGMVHPAFSSAMILVIDLFAETRDPQCAARMQSSDKDAYDKQRKEADLRACIDVLERSETCFHMAGRLRDVIGDFETSLQSHSASTCTMTLESQTSSLGEKYPTDTFDIDGPPDVSVTVCNVQDQSVNPLRPSRPSTGLASLYEFANPFFQTPGYSHDHDYPSTHQTPTPSHTLFSQTSSTMPEQSFRSYLESYQVYPFISGNTGYAPGILQHSTEREVWHSPLTDSVQPR